MSSIDDGDSLDRSRSATEQFRSQVFVGTSRLGPREAYENAWEAAKAETSYGGPQRAEIIRQWATAVNPYTDFFCAIRVTDV